MALGQSQPSFEAGAARRLITPDPLLPLSGGMGPTAPAKGKQGELTVRAMVFRANAETLAIVSVDLLGFPGVLGDRARARIPRIAKDRIVIAATHNHSGPEPYAYPDGRGGHTASLKYLDFVIGQIADAVNEAYDRMLPAELRVTTGVVNGQIAYNYYAPDLYDRRAGVLQVREPGGKVIGTLVNYAVHPEVMGSKQGILSPDLVGPLCDRIEAIAGGMAMFVNGAQGGMVTADNRLLDQPMQDRSREVWRDLRRWSECERIGGLLASESLRLIEGAAWQANPKLQAWSKNVTFRVDSEEIWQVLEHSPLKYPHKQDRTIEARVDLINLGDAQMLTIPGEALPNIGFYLKRKMSGKHNFLFGLANEAFGYILTKVDFRSFPRYDYVSRVSLGEMTGEIYIENALEMIRATADSGK
jgi:hypothetical protein